jgi:hypothetical protein
MENSSCQERIAALQQLRQYIEGNGPALQDVVERTARSNPWFTPENQYAALQAIARQFLDPANLEKWVAAYPVLGKGTPPVKVALVLAGNLPLVGFHDWLCVFMAGHNAQIKLSEKDPYLLPHLFGELGHLYPPAADMVEFVERLAGFDAVIATGSNNSARYFEYYFGKYPHIIRKNRNAVAVLTGKESADELLLLGNDIFQYFGMGCRNISKIYVPRDYDFEPLLETLHEYREIILHHKYKHNYDYNYALFLINKIPFKMNGCLLLTESDAIPSRIAALNYGFYDSLEGLDQELQSRAEEIQCVCAGERIGQTTVIPFGQSQEPALWDYADGVDTLAFLEAL